MKFILERYTRSYAGLPPSVWILSLVMLINRSGAMVLPFLTIYLSNELGWEEGFAGRSIAVYGIGACIGSVLGGWLTARMGAFRVQQASLILTAIGFVVLSQMNTKPTVLLALLSVAIAAESLRPANVTAISEAAAPHLHRRAFALNRIAINLGFTFGPAIGGILASFHFQSLFFVDAATCMIAAVVLTRMSREPAATPTICDTGDPASPVCPANTFQFACFALTSLMVFLIFFQLLSTYPIYLRNHLDVAEWQIGLLFAINTLIIVVFEMMLTEMLQRFSALKVIAFGALLICEGFALLSIGKDVVGGLGLAVAAVLVWTVGEMIAMPAMTAFVSQSSTATKRAKRIGIYSMTIAIGFVVAPLVGTRCYEIQPKLIWWVSGAMGAITFLGYWWLDANVKQPAGLLSEALFVNERSTHSIAELRRRSANDLGIEFVEPHV